MVRVSRGGLTKEAARRLAWNGRASSAVLTKVNDRETLDERGKRLMEESQRKLREAREALEQSAGAAKVTRISRTPD